MTNRHPASHACLRKVKKAPASEGNPNKVAQARTASGRGDDKNCSKSYGKKILQVCQCVSASEESPFSTYLGAHFAQVAEFAVFVLNLSA